MRLESQAEVQVMKVMGAVIRSLDFILKITRNP